MILNIRRLQQLIVLAEEGNITRSAGRLGMTQPALSRSITALEDAYELQLFERGRTGVTLTAAGDDLLADARQVVGMIRTIEQNLALQSRGLAGRIAFAIGPTAAHYKLPLILSECLARWPALSITASIQNSSRIVEGVKDGVLDFGVCAANNLALGTSLVAQSLDKVPFGYFVRGGHPLLDIGPSLNWNDLKPYPRANTALPSSVDARLTSAFRPLHATVECNDFETLRRTTLATDMVWMTGNRFVQNELAAGQMVEIAPVGLKCPEPANIVLIRLANRIQNPAACHVLGVIEEMTSR